MICSLAAVSAAFGEDGSINQAIASLNARAKTPADQQLVLNAISQQTKIPEATLQGQMKQTKLGYGELLAANSMAQASGQKLDALLARKQSKGWSEFATELKVDQSSIIARLRNANKMVQAAQKSGAVAKATATPAATATPKRFIPGRFSVDP